MEKYFGLRLSPMSPCCNSLVQSKESIRNAMKDNNHLDYLS